ncbi:MAG TPA: PEP-CTERM sorting domain-containing protein [Burkholderiaceae bacterium]|nr:PEP-CTERM sorting domain-containing protein [Burkholderiaceae bacterium]
MAESHHYSSSRDELWREKQMRKTLVALMAAMALGSANAEFTKDGRDIVDSATGVRWLDMPYTQGLSYFDVESHLSTAYLGYRIATYDEVRTLFGDAGFWIDTYPYQSTDPGRLALGQSFFDAFTGAVNPSASAGTELVMGYVYQPQGSLVYPPAGYGGPPAGHIQWASGVGYRPDGVVSTAFTDATAPWTTVSSPQYATWMVAVPPVPEPSTWMLLAIGLGALGVAKRRRVGSQSRAA